MTQQYFELEIFPQKNYDVFLDLVESIVEDAIEESEKSIIIRSEDSLEDIKEAIARYKTIGVSAGSLFVFKGKYRAVLISYPDLAERKDLYQIH